MKKSDKIVLSGIFKILEMHIEIVRGQTETFIKNKQMQITSLSWCYISGPIKVTQALMLTFLIQPS